MRYLEHNETLCLAAGKVFSEYSSGSGIRDEITSWVSAPVIFMYVSRVIEEARDRGIKRLYFLARDGYSMERAAKAVCRSRGYDIDIRYLYCSRFSLRMAAYRFKDDSAYDRLFYEAYRLSAYNLLSRADFDDEGRRAVYDDIGYDDDNERQPMSRENFHILCEKIKKSAAFDEILTKRSDASYNSLIGYLKQEGLFDEKHIGIVDLGWTGSMQYTMKRILESADCFSKITGFYFGLLEKPPVCEGNEYFAWLFDAYSNASFKAAFSHNLMECICTAPHGMTVGYELCDDKYVPVMKECENDISITQRQSDIIASFAEYGADHVCSEGDKKLAAKLLKELMFRPERDEAECMGIYSFCDDVGEQYHHSIAANSTEKILRNNLLMARLMKKTVQDEQLYWFYGSLVMSDVKLKALYRADYYLYQLLRYFIKQIKKQ